MEGSAKMRSCQDYINMMHELLELEEGLTDWEIDFLESLCNQGWRNPDKWYFTDKQIDKFEQIYNRRM